MSGADVTSTLFLDFRLKVIESFSLSSASVTP